ncbi:MAG: hypothetical protein O7B99_14755, partial [Planctomycetota bacterium]|nr:hypothetical protein [Planctomycetota bacterium]
SQARFNQDYGAMLVEATARRLIFQFVTRTGTVIDTFTIAPAGLPDLYRPIVGAGSEWRYLDDGSDPGASWTAPEFDDAGWASGAAPLGYGDGDEATVVGFGPNEDQKFITTWFRQAFEVADPDVFDQLAVRLQRDDGGVVYLNGTEIFRSNLPSGDVTSATEAKSAVVTSAEDAFFETLADPSLLVPGRNVLAVEIHQSGADSPDVSFDLTLSGRRPPPPIVPRGSIWRYYAGWEAGAGWRLPSFDDSEWSRGAAELGYGDGDEATVIDHGEGQARPLTTWFRHAFEVEDASTYRALLLRILRDDGAVAYLNGAEVYRFNLPLGDIGPATPAGLEMRGKRERRFLETSIDPALLFDGRNVLAVEIHQRGPESEDMSFDLELVGLP